MKDRFNEAGRVIGAQRRRDSEGGAILSKSHGRSLRAAHADSAPYCGLPGAYFPLPNP